MSHFISLPSEILSTLLPFSFSTSMPPVMETLCPRALDHPRPLLHPTRSPIRSPTKQPVVICCLPTPPTTPLSSPYITTSTHVELSTPSIPEGGGEGLAGRAQKFEANRATTLSVEDRAMMDELMNLTCTREYCGEYQVFYFPLRCGDRGKFEGRRRIWS